MSEFPRTKHEIKFISIYRGIMLGWIFRKWNEGRGLGLD